MSADRRQEPRIPTNLVIKVSYGSVGEFMEKYAENISRKGMFIRTREPRPVGSTVSFALALKDGERVIQGTGTVRWIRPGTGQENGGTSPGMGIEFLTLDDDSRFLVDLIESSKEHATQPKQKMPPVAAAVPHVPPIAAPAALPPKGAQGLPPELELALYDPPPSQSSQRDVVPLPAPVRATPAPQIAPGDASGSPGTTAGREEVRPPREPVRLQEPPRATPVLWGTPAAVASPPSQRPPVRSVLPVPASAVPVAPVSWPASVPSAAPVPLPAPTAPVSNAPVPLPAPVLNAPVPLPAPTAPVSNAPTPVFRPAVASAGVPANATRGADPEREAREASHRAADALAERRHGEAEAALEWAVAQQPRVARYRFELGLLHFHASASSPGGQRDNAAAAAFARAAELDPKWDLPLVYLGHVFQRQGRYSEALDALREAQKRNPSGSGPREFSDLQASRRWRRQSLAAVALLVVTASASAGLWVGRFMTPPPAPVMQPLPVAVLAPVASPPPASSPVPTAAPVPVVAPPSALAEATPPPVATPPAPVAAVPAPAEAPPVAAASAPAASTRRSSKSPIRGRSPGPRAEESSEVGASAMVKKGDAALRAGKVDEALNLFQQAIASNARYASAHRGLGAVYVMQGQDDRAKASYHTYLQLAPNAPDAPRIKALIEEM